MNEKLEKRKAFIINFLYFIIMVGVLYFILKKLFPIFLPFVIGLLVAVILNPVIRFLSNKIRLDRKFFAPVAVVLFYVLLGILIYFFGARIFAFIQEMAKKLPAYYETHIEPQLSMLMDKIAGSFPGNQDRVMAVADSLENTMQEVVLKASGSIISLGASYVVAFPGLLIQLLFSVISSFFFTADLENVKNFVLRQMPDKKRDMIVDVAKNAKVMVGKILKVYLFLMCVTFVELYVGFLILRVDMPLLYAFLIAIVDILPVLGTGTVLIPWGLVSCVLGNVGFGVGILILYLFITMVRQILEPKIIGQQVGLHPIVTLICIFAGAKVMGIWGIFLFPIMATVLKKMNDEGTIHLWR
ncbi:sporulation integral membrane protein YtvI [Lacrimispora sp. NSJ-141]|uniref:Sporulation integral membrane protein YtvI n=1 Tax=Lientehia hominis TaxID=2897778 RepID=A0AAP2RJB4_9FIRM|nr:sporulation integral membrane protein YtvI [Lientehia hominis]MCD2492454.1 sporulation integral membrane protein YtvI [Lientehia hominis]